MTTARPNITARPTELHFILVKLSLNQNGLKSLKWPGVKVTKKTAYIVNSDVKPFQKGEEKLDVRNLCSAIPNFEVSCSIKWTTKYVLLAKY